MDEQDTHLTAPFRKAMAEDLEQVLPLARQTVPGFVEELWQRLSEPGETADDFGRRAQGAFIEEGNMIVADLNDSVAAMLISYPMADTPNPHVPGMDDMLKPLIRLFSKAAGTWYLHGLATAPAFAGQGLGTRLMGMAEDLARRGEKNRISLVVVDTNLQAISFYDRRGYATTASEPIVKAGWDTTALNWLLMEKPLP